MGMRDPAAGDLNRRITFQRRTRVTSANGDQTDAWTDVATVAAKVSPLRGGETIQAARLGGTETFEITVYSTVSTRTLTPDDRAVDARSGRKLNLKWAANWDERDRFITLIAEAGSPADE